ncbi:MAG TPA: hypothetical protein VEP90_07370 [Methylomirabilota bacterium]|nr:hypothetical protein [Methylomirabilota bacterium]
MIDYEFLYAFTKEVLKLDKSIRWVGIANKYGVLLNTEHREGLHPLMSDEDNEEYAHLTVTRHKTRIKFEPKIGPLIYALGKYEKLNRATLHINDNSYMLIALDVEEKNFDNIITEKVIPLIKQEKEKFIFDDEKGATPDKTTTA